jgi:sialidase-1
MIAMRKRISVILIMLAGLVLPGVPAAAERKLEGRVKVFLGTPTLAMQQIFSGERFPNIVVTRTGTVLATWGTSAVRARRSEDGGKSWGEVITIASPGFQGGGTTVDETTGDILAFVEERHPPAPLTVYRSTDDGLTWAAEEVTIHPDSEGNMPSMHMNEHGITLRHGEHKGRLIRPSRFYAGKNEQARWPQHYTNAIYSDDGGKTWNTSDPFPAKGTGEATMAELSNGLIYYNSRRHWAEEGASPLRRWTAWSDDGGVSWKGLSICEVLPDGPQNSNYGCMGGLVRLPVHRKDILVYSNCDSPTGRDHGTVWASFDGGKTWPLKRQVFEGRHAYSSLSAGLAGTPSEGWIYLNFEGGPEGGSTVARFNLSWLLEGEETGDGSIPGSLQK